MWKTKHLNESICIDCLEGEEPEEYTYVGESFRTAYKRYKYYWDGAKDSFMNNNAIDKHGGRKDVKWKFVVVRTLQKVLLQT